ncbi:hypothetical protein FOCC_FOCC017037 [Frankliniella occidentalis]|uniref:Uncharacterized protein LOC113210039 n=1 Tax=Frankliniella occidentalis TaxID=133901 RepID=A0A6J1SS31_FRAOC|nr:uncharacterized protein LOC113210039 [Frankliniella occidentalis]KAE8737499.1 hypothetical protein FOCC_FOCC017037 [Frankliniella occidentalis]
MQPTRAPRRALLPLLLLAVLAAVMDAKPLEPCPSSCRCFLSEGLKRADCRHVPEWADQQSDAQDVRVLPPPAGRGARSSALHLTHFEVFPKVLQLAVTNRSLVEVIPSGFHGLHSLQSLDLSNNLLARFNYKVFLRMPALRRLVLAGNPIALEKDIPLLTSKSLLSLDLSHCDIVDVPRGSLEGMRNLTSLSLRGNPLRLEKNQPLLSARTTVVELDLSACELDSIPDGVLDVLAGLRRLYLDGNNLHTVERGVLPRGLHHLDLSANQVQDVPTAVLSSLRNLTKLELSDNPVKCTCSLIGMQGWLSRRVVVMERPVVCAEPPQYKGLSWTKVDLLELCRAEQSNSTADTSESSSSSDESSDDDDEDDDSPAAASTNNGLGTAFDDDPFLDSLEDLDSLERAPASYEQYTHDNGNGIQSSAMPMKLKVHTLDAAMHPPRVLSHNDINYFQADQADQPYDQTTARPGHDETEPTTVAVPAEHDEHEEHEEHAEPAKSEEPAEIREPAETEEASAEEVKAGEDMGSDGDDGEGYGMEDGEEDEQANSEENITEKDAEVFMRNADTIAMGKSMPEATGQEKETEMEAEHATVAPTAIPATDEPTTAPDTEHVTEAEAVPTEVPVAAVPVDVALEEQEKETSAVEAEHGAEPTGELLPGAPLVDEVTTQPPLETTTAQVEGQDQHQGEHEQGGEGHLVDAELVTETPEATTTVASDVMLLVPVGSEDGDRSAHGRALDGEGQAETEHGEHHEGEHGEHSEDKHDDEHQGAGVIVPVTEPEAATSPPEDAKPEGEAGADSAIVVPVVPALPTEVTTVLPQPAVEEEIVPEVAKNIVGVGQENDGAIAVVPEEPAAEVPTAAAPPVVPEGEREPVVETVDAPKSVSEVESIPVPAPEAPVDTVDSATPDTDAETVAAAAPDDAKRNEELAVQRVTPGGGEAEDPESELQKSTITYVILGCIVLAMVVLVLYALLRSKAKQADNGSGGKPARIRRENGDARNHSHPEGTEMKDMMNPLLGPGGTHPENADHPEHGRRASLVSLELIREEEDETTRLQPPGADEEGTLPRAKGAADSEKTPEPPRRTGNGKATVPNGKSNGKANGDANGKPNGKANGKANGKPAVTGELAPSPTSTVAADPAATPRTQRAAEQPSKVTVKAGVISTPVPRTPVLVNRSNGVNGVNGKLNGLNRSA